MKSQAAKLYEKTGITKKLEKKVRKKNKDIKYWRVFIGKKRESEKTFELKFEKTTFENSEKTARP